MRTLLLLVSTVAVAEPVTFLRDVAPILNKAGCTSGHVSRRGEGQERFQAVAARLRSGIRLRGAAVRFVRTAVQSRRSVAQPDAGQADAAGGARRRIAHRDQTRRITRRFSIGSAQGVPFGDPAKDNVAALEVVPAEVVMPKPGETMTVKIVARFADGLTRDVTNEAVIESNTPTVAKVDAKARGERRTHRRGRRCWCGTRASSRRCRSPC